MPLCYYLLSWENRKYINFLLFIVSRETLPIGNKVPNREFYWSPDRKFYSRLGIWSCKSVWSTDNFVKKLIFLRKNESSLEKENSFIKGFFSSKSKFIKKVVYKAKVVIQNSAIKCYHELHLIPRKDLEMLILAAPLFLLTKVIL